MCLLGGYLTQKPMSTRASDRLVHVLTESLGLLAEFGDSYPHPAPETTRLLAGGCKLEGPLLASPCPTHSSEPGQQNKG